MNYIHLFAGDLVEINDDILEKYIEPTYTEDGDRVNSIFFIEIKIQKYEPGCIEWNHWGSSIKLKEALVNHSYYEYWKDRIPDIYGRYAILLHDPNEIATSDTSLIKYYGKIEFKIQKYNLTEVDYGCA